MYRHGEVEWSPGKVQAAHAMSINSSTLTSRIGGVFRHGDALQYRIVLRQSSEAAAGQARPWEVAVWSNRLLVQGGQPREKPVQ